jgi:hypothetical protein
MHAPVSERGRVLYVFASPLQYFLCRLIERAYPSAEPLGVRYTSAGDFAAAIADIDKLLGPAPFATITYAIGDHFEPGPTARAFFSNRFNPTEVELFLLLSERGARFCAYEDGLSLYIDHFFLHPSWRDDNRALAARNKLKLLLRRYTNFRDGDVRPSFFPLRAFDSFYSIFPDIPGRSPQSAWYPLAPALLALATEQPVQDRAALVLSQSLVTDGFVDQDTYCQFLIARIEELREQFSRVCFKPHPRDGEELVQRVLRATGCELLAPAFERVPVELYLSSHPATSVYGFWSSSLVYAAGAMGLRAQSFAPLLARGARVRPSFAATWSAMEPKLARYGVESYAPINR